MFLKQNPETGYWTSCYTKDGEYYGELVRVHPKFACAGPRGCAIHDRPTDHPLKNAPLFWRDDVSTLERICEHGIGHPDHDSVTYLVSTGDLNARVHTCDGCCG